VTGDEMPLKPLKIVLTACGCPGASTLIRMLKQNGERKIEIIGTDMSSEAIGRYLCDSFYRVPSGTNPNYVPSMMKIVETEKPDLIFPESSNEVLSLAKSKKEFEASGTIVIVSSPESIELARNKYLMYDAVKNRNGIVLPTYYSVSNLDDFLKAVYKLNYPDSPIVFKPHIGKGSRGVRIIDPNANRMHQLMEEKPTNKFMSLEEFTEIFEEVEDKDFPDLLVMEFLSGMEKTADSLVMDGHELLTTIKTVERARWGVIVEGELVHDDGLVDQSREILKSIPLSYCVNIQYIADKLIEINPRVSTFIYQKNLIAPYLAIKLALNEISEDVVKAYRSKIDYGRRMIIYMDQVFHKNEERVL
jgi:carbamoyl-phosphate synthase large subunit